MTVHAMAHAACALFLGARGNGAGGVDDELAGKIADVRIYDRAIAPSEAAVVFSTPTTWTQYDALGRPTHVTDALGGYSGDPGHTMVTA